MDYFAYINSMRAIIYKITNLLNNKVYIGSTKSWEIRFKAHLSRLNGNYHINKHLQSAWNKYGEENFKFEILREVPENILRRAEQFYINKYQSLNPKYGYNKAIVVSNTWDNQEKTIKVKNTIYFGCYNKKGKLVKVFKTIHDVYEFLGNRSTRVYEACNSNLTKTADGYYWLRLDVSKDKFKNNIIVKKRKGRHRSIIQNNMNNEFIKEWSSAVEASKELKLSSFNITRCLRTNNTYKNYKWFYSAPLTSNSY